MLWEIFTLNIVLHCSLVWLVKCVRVDTTPRTWADASAACILHGSQNNGELSVSSLDTSSIPDGSTSLYWIGAINSYTSWFEMRDCFEVPSGTSGYVNQRAISDTKNPVFECCNSCEGTSDNFALSDITCYCITSNIPTGFNACSKRSFTNAPIDFYGTEVDGNTNTVPTVHYRKRTGSPPTKGNGTGNCAAVYGSSEPLSHEYLDCNTQLGYLCYGNNGVVITTRYNPTLKTWSNAVLDCALTLAVGYSGYYENAPSDGTRTWTGISRRSKQIWRSGVPTDGTTYMYNCLAVNKGRQLTIQDCSTSLESLCEGVDGNWSDWSVWSACSVTCGDGTQQRTRTCNNPAPVSGGKQCTGNDEQSNTCNKRQCPIDGNWGDWSVWSDCPVTCGGGTQQRTRICNNPEPVNGGKKCPGNDEESNNCNERQCTIDGNWGAWSMWSACSLTCGNGLKRRTKPCNNPAPVNGGKNCTGNNEEEITCNDRECQESSTTKMTTTQKLTKSADKPVSTTKVTSASNTSTYMMATHESVTPLTTETNHSMSVTFVLSNIKPTVRDGVNIAQITGAACGGVIFIILILVLVAVFLKRARAKTTGNNATENKDVVVTYDVANEQIAQKEKNTQTRDDHIYDGSEENMYDHTDDKRSRTENTNHYGVVDEKTTDNVYDHTNGSNLGDMYESTCRSQNNQILMDNEYGSVMPSKADDVYDTTSRTRKEVVINDNEYGSIAHDNGNDVYDHTVRDNKSDNADRENYDTM